MCKERTRNIEIVAAQGFRMRGSRLSPPATKSREIERFRGFLQLIGTLTRADFCSNLPPIGSHPLRSYTLFKPHYLTVPPVTEELLKALPVLVFAVFFSDDRKDILPTAMSVGIGFSIDPQGYNYARYSAFVPNARSLLTPDMGIDRSYLSPAEPWRDESRDEMLRMTLRVNGKPDYTLVLPADEEYLNAVKAYLDIDVFADAMLCDIRFKVPYIGELIRDTDCPAVEDYNDFAEALEDIWQTGR